MTRSHPRLLHAAVPALLAIAAVLVAPPARALAHAAFLASAPAPGQRLTAPPAAIAMRFTEAINRRLSTAALYEVATGRRVAARVTAPSARRLELRPRGAVGRGAYRVEWHSVSADDGHALEGSFSFGVRAAAVGAARSSQAGPLADGGWLRVLVRGLLYPALFVFAGGALLNALLGRPRRSWLAPPRVMRRLSASGAAAVEHRAHAVVANAALLAMPLALLSAVLDAVDAAGGLSRRAVRDYLLSGSAGLGRLGIVAFVGIGALAARRAPRAAALAGVLALGSLAVAGHAASAPQRGLAMLTDWLHLVAASAWLGGIAVIALTWLPVVRGESQALRRAVMRHVLARFGRVALPAFAVVVVTGGLNALIELPRVAALWQTAYGRVLSVKIALVGLIATASYTHALRLRPRLAAANPHPDTRLDRRHWRLLGAEPVLGAGVTLAVAFLVAFPLPRTAARAAPPAARPAACEPACPQPTPKPDELSVAEEGGSNLVAAWIRRGPRGLSGQVRLLDMQGRPASTPFEIEAAKAISVSCGPGCRRFTIPALPSTLRVNVVERGHEYAAVLPTTWRAGQSVRARRLLERAQATMRRLRTVREVERVNSVPGTYAFTRYALQAPDRFAYTNSLLEAPARRPKVQGRSITIGEVQWTHDRTLGWQKGRFGGGVRFRTRSWFDWTSYATAVRLLTITREHGRRTAVLALADPGTPAWWRLWVDLRTLRVIHSRLITTAHYMTQRFFAFNARIVIRPPG